MRIKVVLLLVFLSGILFLALRKPAGPAVRQTAPPPQQEAIAVPADPPSPGHDESDHSHAPAPAQNAQAKPLTPELAWEQPIQEPVFAAFKDWTERHRTAADAQAKAALEEEGTTLARTRLGAMADLIQSNPERAVQLAVPDSVRAALPESVRALLEQTMDSTGDYEVICVMPVPGQKTVAPFIRSAIIGGVAHRVFTYGRGLDYVTRRNMPIRGIAVAASVIGRLPSDPTGLRPAYLVAMSPPLDGSDAGFDTPQIPTNLPTAESSYTEGRKRYLLMRVDFPDFIGDVFPTNNALTHMVDMSNFLAAISYNKHIIAPVGKGSAITPVMRMANNASFYDDKGLSDLYPEARAAAQNVFGYDLSEFDFFFVCTGSRPSYGYAGLGYVGGVGYHLANSYFDVRTSAHELGHNLGLSHANWWETGDRSTIGAGSNQEYGDPFDTMGGSGGGSRHFSASFKARLDWIPASDAITVGSSGVYRLHAHDIVAAPFGVRAIRLNRLSGNPYWIEFRQLWTANKALMNGVNFRWASGSSQLLDMTAGSDDGKDDSSLTIGRTFSDWSNNVHVTPMRKGNTYPESIDLAINLGSFPGNQSPSAIARASVASTAVGQAVTFTATAIDPNGDTLAYAWDFGDGDYSVDNAATTTHSFAAAGEYYVEVTVSDMKGGIARDSVIVNVGSPGTFSIGGRVLNSEGKPLSGIRVSVSDTRYAFSESDGTYTITRLAAGTYSVTAIDPVADAYTFANPFFNNPVTVGPDFATADFIVSTNPPAFVTPLIAANSTWKYLDNGSNQGTTWITPGFNDAAWSAGVGILGYTDGNDQIDTTLSFGPDSGNKYITTYFRRAFTVTDPGDFTSLLLKVLRDDGVVVYLNGAEIFRSNMGSGTPGYTTTASGTAAEPHTYLQQPLSLTGLLAGNNVIAAEVHQSSASSSDAAFDLALDGLTATNAAAFNMVYISNPAFQQSFSNPASITINAFARSSAGTASQVDFYVDGVKIGEDLTTPFGTVWADPAVGSHSLVAVASFSGNAVTSAPVLITVTGLPSLAIELTSPVSGSEFTLPASVTVAANVIAGPAPISTVQFFANGAPAGQDNLAPYTTALIESVEGTKDIIAVATDSLGNSATSAPVSLSFSQPATATQIISFGDLWKYLDDGSNLGTGWTAGTFDDRLWSAGPARLGYGNDGENTVVSFGPNTNQRHITTYFRKTFTVADPSVFGGLLLRILRDDGVIVHLNGEEVFRNNLVSGLVNWNTLASTAIEGAGETTPIEVNLGTSGLLAGTNTIAVEIHQASTSSSDVGFDLALVGLDAVTPGQNVYLTQPGDGARFNAPGSIALSAYASPALGGAPQSVSYYANGSFLGAGSPLAPFDFVWSNVPVGNYQLTVVADWAGLASTSAPVSVVVGDPPPRIQPVSNGIIPRGSTWRIWDNVAAVEPGWQNIGFNDSAWPFRTARLGWGLDGEITTLTEGRITHYFRRPVNVANSASYNELLFQFARDDGAVVYLNGVEIFRSNMPEGLITPTTLAATGVNTPDETTYYQVSIPTSGSGLLTGSNVVAVELHQSSASSSDAGFDLQLTGYGTTEPRVYLTSPAAEASFPSSATIQIEALARGVGTNGVTKVEFFANGSKLGESLAAPWRFSLSNAPLGALVLTARSTDLSGVAVDSVPLTIAVGRERVITTLIASNSVWKYLDTGVNQGTAWINRNFNDTAWRSGPARLGFGGDGEVTVINGGSSSARFPTIYFRKPFVVQAGAVYTNLTFKLVRDDGAVVYLNGIEMFRSNMGAGQVLYSTLAAAADDEQSFFPTTIAVTNLPAGTNIVAVEVHQSSATSSDLGFNLELTASGYEDEAAPPLLTAILADGMVELRWPATAVGWQVYTAPAIDTPANAWVVASGSLVQVSGQNVFTVARGGGNEFFRLRKP